MRAALPLCLALAAPLTAQAAETLRCPTAGYCTNSLTCAPDSAVMVITREKNGDATYGWEGEETRFTASPHRVGGLSIYDTASAGAAQTLVLADNMQASFAVASLLGAGADAQFYSSIQALTCQRT